MNRVFKVAIFLSSDVKRLSTSWYFKTKYVQRDLPGSDMNIQYRFNPPESADAFHTG